MSPLCRLAAASCTLLLLAGCAPASVSTDRPASAKADAVMRIVREALTQSHLNAVIVRVTVDGEEVVTAAVGESTTGVPATPAMHFRNGAVAISYMSTLLLKLAEEGTVGLDDKLSSWLPENIPDDGDPTTIVHGDYRLGNLIVHPTEPRVVAVLDWELSTLGHPLCDVAYNCLGYHLEEPPHGYATVDFSALGMPTEQEYVAAYCRRTGRTSIPNWNYYLAFSLFRLAAIAQGVYRRGLQGNSSNPESIKMSKSARERAELAWSLVS